MTIKGKKNSKRFDYLPNRANKYSIRRFSVGTTSILIGATLLFGLDYQDAQAAETTSGSSTTATSTDTSTQTTTNTNTQATSNNLSVSSASSTSVATAGTSAPSTTTGSPMRLLRVSSLNDSTPMTSYRAYSCQ
nr:YSIRK-type signal peptide-containing protein [Staphylococcus hyicus]